MSVKTTTVLTRKDAEERLFNKLRDETDDLIRELIRDKSNEELEEELEEPYDNYSINDRPDMSQEAINKKKELERRLKGN